MSLTRQQMIEALAEAYQSGKDARDGEVEELKAHVADLLQRHRDLLAQIARAA